jgi:hypothetical protein
MVGLSWFYEMNLGIVLLSVSVLLIFASQLGYFMGCRSRDRYKKIGDLADFVPSSMLGLLSLILGFTFSMAINRFDYRKELVIKEANAIGTVYLRSRLMKPEHSLQIGPILKRYVDARLEFFSAGNDAAHIQQAENKTTLLHSLLWEEAVKIIQSNRSPIEGLFVASLNDLIDLQTERFIALHNRIPGSVYWAILLIACIGLGTFNFSNGIQGKERRWTPILLALLFGVVFALIHDLDRPRSGTITASQEAMEVLQKSLNQ